ncbi:MAG: alcohol dehydrogenase catalytic domain-containing protein [Candidatus Latescibacterota bacterium]|nr:alcohol dehydrogenase catalytic domain-containing protein [Candidatus Latescibacterota bacterium]
MKACVYADLETVEIHDIPKPVAAHDEVLIKVSRAGICGTDLHIFLGHMDQRVAKPLVMGHEMSGALVEAPAATGYRVGDRVVVEPTVFCGKCAACRRGHTHICQNLNFLGIDSAGAFQEYWNAPIDRLHRIPPELSDNAAAMIEPLAVAVHDVRRAQVELEDQAVVIGGGPIGLLVAHAARLDGAEVIISEVNPYRLKMAESCGFRTVDPTQTDLTESVMDWTNGDGCDIVFEVSGSASGAKVMTELLRVRGRVCLVGVHPSPPEVDLHKFFWRELELIGCRVYQSVDFERAIRVAASRQIDLESLVSKVVPYEEASWGFKQMRDGGDIVKVLIDCQS